MSCSTPAPASPNAANAPPIDRMLQAGVRTTSMAALIGELAGTFDEPLTQQAIGVLYALAGTVA